MKKENIIKIKIGDDRRLLVFPENEDFEYIYRTASGVHWDNRVVRKLQFLNNFRLKKQNA
ncbi:MAG: hypothetical protein LBU85_08100 [Treponema sp.]|jgi:hypothetical protein|nr:hypothetical protein [Treponema sp.]